MYKQELVYRNDIDGLRAVAVLGVLFFHAFPSLLPGGFAGVDVFFVISGFLITRSIYPDLINKKFSVWQFYDHRIRRIFPALLVVLLVVWMLGLALLLPHELQELGVSLVSSAFFGNNFLLYAQAGYFDTHAEQKPLLHLWSLAVEEQFYIVWPLLLWLVVKNTKQTCIFIFGLLFLSLIPCLAITEKYPTAAFFLPFFRAWELIAGAVVALYRPRILRFLPMVKCDGAWLSFFGFLVLLYAYVFLGGDQPYPGWRALLPVAGGVLIILADPTSWFSRILATRVLVAVGLISYPLYLWHWPIFSFARILFGNLSSTLIFVLIIVSFVLSWITYKYLEKPVRFSVWSQCHNRFVSLFAVFLLLIMGGLGNYTRIHDGFPGRLDTAEWKSLNWTDAQVADKRCKSDFGLEGLYCLTSGTQPPSVVLIGDSHANHFFGGLSSVLDKNETLALVSGPLNLEDADLWQNVDWIGRNKSIHTIFISYHSARINEKHNPFSGSVYRIIKEMQVAGKKIAFILDNPEFSFDPRLCASRPPIAVKLGAGISRSDQCSESKNNVLKNRRGYEAYVANLQKDFPNVFIVDAIGPFCDDTQCYALADGQLLYRDSHHLTLNGSMYAFRGRKLEWLER